MRKLLFILLIFQVAFAQTRYTESVNSGTISAPMNKVVVIDADGDGTYDDLRAINGNQGSQYDYFVFNGFSLDDSLTVDAYTDFHCNMMADDSGNIHATYPNTGGIEYKRIESPGSSQDNIGDAVDLAIGNSSSHRSILHVRNDSVLIVTRLTGTVGENLWWQLSTDRGKTWNASDTGYVATGLSEIRFGLFDFNDNFALVVWDATNQGYYYLTWNGDGFDAPANSVIVTGQSGCQRYFSMESLGDTIHLVYGILGADDLVHCKGAASGSWSSEVLVDDDNEDRYDPDICTIGSDSLYLVYELDGDIYSRTYYEGTWSDAVEEASTLVQPNIQRQVKEGQDHIYFICRENGSPYDTYLDSIDLGVTYTEIPEGVQISPESFPYTISDTYADTTVVLMCDIEAAGTALFIEGDCDNLILDLNGYDILFNTGDDDYRYGIALATSSYNATTYPGLPSGGFGDGGANGVEIRDSQGTSRIKNMGASGSYCDGITARGADGFKLTGLQSVMTQGTDGETLDLAYCGLLHEITNIDSLINNCSITNRHLNKAVVSFENIRETFYPLIYNVEIYSYAQVGIKFYSQTDQAFASEGLIYNNTYYVNGSVTNKYAQTFTNVSNWKFYDNTINADNGRGVHFNSCAGGESYNNNIDVTEIGNSEYADMPVHGIKLEYCSNVNINRDTVIARTNHESASYYGHANPLDVSVRTSSNNSIDSCSFEAIHEGGANASGTDYSNSFYGTVIEANNGLTITKTAFKSNSNLIRTGWDVANFDITFESCSFDTNGVSFIGNTYPLYFGQTYSFDSLIILNPIVNDGIDLESYQESGSSDGFEYKLKWTLTVTAPTGATIKAYNTSSELVEQAVVSSSSASLDLPEFVADDTDGITEQNDYTVWAILGNDSTSTTITMDQERSTTLNLAGYTPIIIDVINVEAK